MRYLRKVAKGDESDLSPASAKARRGMQRSGVSAEMLTRCFQIEKMQLLST